MQITDPLNNPRLFIEQTKSEALNQLRSGQTVTAQVIKPATNGVAQIDIGGIKLPVQTGVKLEIGQQLALSVIKGGKAPELQLIRNPTPETIQALTLKRILPQQLPIQQLLDTLKTLTASSPTTNAATVAAATKENMIVTLVRELLQLSVNAGTQLPTPQRAGPSQPDINMQHLMSALQSATSTPNTKNEHNHLNRLANHISQLVNHTLPENRPITADRIRQAFEQSGVFLESRLTGMKPSESRLTNTHPIGTDFKAILLKLIAELQPLIVASPALANSGGLKTADTATTLQLLAARIFAELQQLTEGSLARVQLHQLASLPQDENNLRQIWQFELPVPHADGHDDFFIKFEKEVNQADPSEIRWSVTLNFDIPPAGPISAKLNLVGDVISSHFTAEQPEGINRLEKALPKLSEAFEKAGLTVGRLSARQGKPDKIDGPPPQPFPLLDEKA